ncbi:MAG: HAD-IIA family hydrolase [Lachnospiraceae bacterium]|nr:HAD-IIA family hydrolase [Lachnospiraceae bacterium]
MTKKACLDALGRDASELKKKTLWLLDMDGTIYLGNQVFPGTVPFLNRVKELGGRYMMLTNNSSKSVDAYLEKVGRMGIDAAPEEFFTSVHATIQYLHEHHPGERVYAQGTKSFIRQLTEAGIDVTEELDRSATVVVLGLDTELTFEKMNRTSEMLTGFTGAYIATHPDLVCPSEYGAFPDLGSYVIGLEYATGLKPKVIGKPEPAMIEAALQAAGREKEEAVMVGDRVYTDIASGVNAGVTTIGVLSGEASLEDYLSAEKPPTFIFKDIGEVLKLLQA